MYTVECADRQTGGSYVLVVEAGTAEDAVASAVSLGLLAGRAAPVVGSPQASGAGASREMQDLVTYAAPIDRRLTRSPLIVSPKMTIVLSLWLFWLSAVAVWTAWHPWG